MRSNSIRIAALAGILPILLFAVTAHAADGPVTFSNQVVRILQQHCQSCHRPGSIAPFSLLTYTDVVSRAISVKYDVVGHVMPPWKPVDPTGTFQAERRLTEKEIQTLVAWIDGGMPEGSPTDLPAPL